jgi:hypothetical protein
MMYMKSFLGSFFIESDSVVYFWKGGDVFDSEVGLGKEGTWGAANFGCFRLLGRKKE